MGGARDAKVLARDSECSGSWLPGSQRVTWRRQEAENRTPPPQCSLSLSFLLIVVTVIRTTLGVMSPWVSGHQDSHVRSCLAFAYTFPQFSRPKSEKKSLSPGLQASITPSWPSSTWSLSTYHLLSTTPSHPEPLQQVPILRLLV